MRGKMNRLLNLIEVLFGLMILTLPITLLPKRYQFPVLGGKLPHILLFIGLLSFVAYSLKKHSLSIHGKRYFGGFFIWSVFCLILGVWNFPFYDTVIDDFLRNSKMVVLISEILPSFQYNSSLLHGKMFLSYFWYMLRDFFFPFCGLFFIIAGVFQAGKADQLNKYLYRAVYGLSILLALYSIPEVIWLWSGDETCAWILSSINVHLYDPGRYNGWWPPLLWSGQLRSFCLEPSYFGIISVFLVPLLAIDTHRQFRPWKVLLLFIMVFMIFMTKARTAIVIYLGEGIVFFLLTLFFRYSGWKKVLAIWLIVSVGAFSACLAGASVKSSESDVGRLTEKYLNENIVSVVGKDKRSNSARFGNTVALAKIGLDNPVIGVGMGLHSPYMEERIPDFAKDNQEIQNWIKDMHEKTFLESGLPILNEYAAIGAWEGIPGLFLFLLPPLTVIKKGLWINRKQHDFETIGLLVALAGQLACMLSSEMFLTYPLILWYTYWVLDKKEKGWTIS